MNTPQQNALAELSQKTLVEIQVETARTWAYRAWAAYHYATICTSRGDAARALDWLHDATEYEHEAVEHAALTGDDALLAEVRALVERGKSG